MDLRDYLLELMAPIAFEGGVEATQDDVYVEQCAQQVEVHLIDIHPVNISHSRGRLNKTFRAGHGLRHAGGQTEQR